MSTKAPGKEQPSSPPRGDATSPDDVRTAHEAHTLAQMLYGHLNFVAWKTAPMSGAYSSKEEPMFWSDPTLYGATLPYKDPNFPAQTPFMGQVLPQWQNVPRFVPPPVYNYNPNPFFGFHPQLTPTPYMQTWIDPLRRFDTPYLRPFEMQMQAFNPYTFYNVPRPFIY